MGFVGEECPWAGFNETKPSASTVVVAMEIIEAGRTVDCPKLQMSIGVSFLAERLFDFNHLRMTMDEKYTHTHIDAQTHILHIHAYTYIHT